MNGSQFLLWLNPVRLRLRLRLAACGLLIAFIASLGGCSHVPSQAEAPPTPLYHVQPGTWRAIDEQILTASIHARHESNAYARVTMDEWRWRVRQRIDEVFIPWYGSYWTQQWIAYKVTWYTLQYDEGEATPEERLVSYLQEQFYEQVLEPVSSFVDPHAVMEDAAAAYLWELKGRLDQLPLEYRIPVAAFIQHLESIPAIVVQTAPLQNASLYEVLQAVDLPALYTSYHSWCIANVMRPMSRNVFGRKIKSRGFQDGKVRGQRGFRGINVKKHDDYIKCVS